MSILSILSPNSITVEMVSALSKKLNPEGSDLADMLFSRKEDVATLKSWVAEPDCFRDDISRRAADELNKWFS